ncbi:MAG: hypothetical protein PHH83_03715 [Patescibacteria group bacterium]|nr:hypothetical protein [Patescibacteria group bacterium]
MKNIFYGILIITGGFFIVWKTKWIVDNLGRSDWAEEKLGTSGGTVLLYKFIGLLILIFGMLTLAGLKDDFLMGTIGKIFFINQK